MENPTRGEGHSGEEASCFRSLLRQLEVEHVRQVVQLQRQISRLRSAPKSQDSFKDWPSGAEEAHFSFGPLGLCQEEGPGGEVLQGGSFSSLHEGSVHSAQQQAPGLEAAAQQMMLSGEGAKQVVEEISNSIPLDHFTSMDGSRSRSLRGNSWNRRSGSRSPSTNPPDSKKAGAECRGNSDARKGDESSWTAVMVKSKSDREKSGKSSGLPPRPSEETEARIQKQLSPKSLGLLLQEEMRAPSKSSSFLQEPEFKLEDSDSHKPVKSTSSPASQTLTNELKPLAFFNGIIPSMSPSELFESCSMSDGNADDNSPARLSTASIEDHVPKQLLKVNIVGAMHLRRSDWIGKGSSDPYCVLKIPGKPEAVLQTHPCVGTLAPVWDYEVVLDCYEEGDNLEFEVKDKDWLGADDWLGKATLKSSEFHQHGYEGVLTLSEMGPDLESPALLRVHVEVTMKTEVFSMREVWLCKAKSRECPAEKRALMPESLDVLPTLGERTGRSFSTKPSAAAAGMNSSMATGQKSSLVSIEAELGLFDPSSGPRLSWDTVGMLFVVVDLVWLPMQVFDPPDYAPMLFMSWVAVFYWSIDIFVTINTGIVKKGGYMIMDRRQVFALYSKRWLVPDLLLVIVEWIFLCNVGEGESAGAARATKFMRVSRSMRLLRLMRLAKIREFFFTFQDLFNSEWMIVSFMVGRNLLTILALNHILACTWFLVGVTNPNGWVHHVGEMADKTFAVQYLACLQWSMAQFTPGASPLEPFTTGERTFSICVLALGLVVATCFVSNITTTVSAVWAIQRNESTQNLLLKKFLKQNNISRSLGSRVTRYIDCVMELRQQKVHFSRVQYLSFLSGPLHVELLSELREPQLCVHKMFPRYKDVSICAFRELCTTALEQTNFARNDMVFRKGVQAKHMFFINSGALVYRHYCNHSREYLKSKLETGQWCCEIALWAPWSHTGDMKAVSDCDITLLSISRFCEVTSSDHDAHRFARNYCRRFMERVHQVASFDTCSITDLRPKVHVPGLDRDLGGPERRTPSGSASLAMTSAARYVRESEDMEAELVAFPNEPPPTHHRRGERPSQDGPQHQRADQRRFTFNDLRCLTPRRSNPARGMR